MSVLRDMLSKELKMDVIHSIETTIMNARIKENIDEVTYELNMKQLAVLKVELCRPSVSRVDDSLDKLLKWIVDEPEPEEIVFTDEEDEDDGYIPF